MPLTNHKSVYLNAVLNTPTFAIICIDKFGIIQEFNYGAEVMFGYQAQEVLNQNVSILMPFPYSKDHDSYIAAYFETGNSKIIGSSRETIAKKKSGETFEIELRIDTFNDGSDIFFIGYILDVSHTKKLEKTNYVFDSIVEHASYGILTLTLDNSIILWNKGAETITGYSAENTIGKNIATVIQDLDNELIQNILSGKSTSIKNEELTLKKQNGNIIDISATFSLIENKYKKAIGICILFHDISYQKKFIKDLQESETLFRTVIDSSSMAYVLYDDNNGFIDYVNPAFENFFGSSVSTIDAWWNIAFLDSQYRESVATEWMMKIHNAANDSQHIFEPMEIETVDKNGETKWFLVEATALEGMITKTQLVTLNNITQIKKTSKDLEESEFRWKFAVDGSGDGLWDWNLCEDTIFFSSRWKTMLGFNEEDIGNSLDSWKELVHPEDIENTLQEVNHYLQGKSSIYVNEHRLRCKNGNYKWILGRGMIVDRDEHGKPLRMIGTHTDINERKIIESRNKQLLNIVEESIDFIAMFNLENTITYLNCEGKKMIGLTCSASISDVKISELFSAKEQQKLLTISIPRAKTSGFWQGESTLIHPKGHGIPVSQIVMAHFDSHNQIVAFSMIMRNVAAQKNMERIIIKAKEEAEELAKSKSEFLANMSHEIRTPINAILGLAFILNKKSLPADDRRLVDKILKSGQLLLGTINDILDISKIDSGNCNLENTEFDLDSILNSLATVMAFSSSQKDINLIISPPPNLKEIVLIGDSLRLQQILVNLSSNAIKFTNSGYVVVDVTCFKQTDNFISLIFSVKDTGIGIAPQNQEAIFNSFAQADTSITRNYGGTGLGLSISRHLVRLMGGELFLESTEGKGSTFSFNVDFKYLPQEITTSIEKKKVLVVNDNPLECEALCDTVLSLGWQPTLCNNDALKTLELSSFNVILLDWLTLHKDNVSFSHLSLQPQHKIILLYTEYERKNFSEFIVDFPLKLVQTQSKIISGEFVFDTPPIFLNKPLTSLALKTAVFSEENFVFKQSKRLNDLKILIVDDNEINLEVARRIFSDEGALITTLNNGFETLDWLQENKRESVDVVLMDIQMPGMDGCETTACIRKMPDFENLPIIALSAGVLKAQMDKAQQAGLHEFITKPFNVDIAIEQICKVLNKHFSSKKIADNKQENPLKFAGLDVEQALQSWKDIGVYQTYLQQFLDSYEPEIEQIEKLSADDMADAAHKIKGAARVLGLVDIGHITEELEEVADAGEPVTEIIDNLKQHLVIAKNSIIAFLATPASESSLKN
jgi:PAS domain S-box-containing protein